MEGFDNSGSGNQGTTLMTPYYPPYQKKGLNNSDLPIVDIDLFSASAGDSSGVSSKQTSRSPFSSSSDSESETPGSSINRYLGLPMNTDGNGVHQEIKLKEEFLGLESQKQIGGGDHMDNILWENDCTSYQELLCKLVKTEEELSNANLKLRLSEKEVINSKSQIVNSEGQLHHVLKELKLREADLEFEKEKVLKLQNQTSDLETHVQDCCCKIAKLTEELAEAREHLRVSNDEIAGLKNKCDAAHELQCQLELAQQNVAAFEAQLDSGRNQIRELEEKIIWYKGNESKRELEVQNLKAEMLDAQAKYSLEKELLQSDVLSLSEARAQLDSALKEWELRSHLLENKLRQCEGEKLKLEEQNAAQEMVLQGEISCLKEELGERRHDIEALNKEIDSHKHKYDMIVAENDGANARIHKLIADARTRDNQIKNMEKDLCLFHAHHEELKSISEARLNEVNELKLKVEQLEVVVARQKAVISERAEEKREAIRQLCYALDHFKNGYQELRQAFTEQKRHAAVTS
ncbi:protein NETWORKED 4B-like [Prosopis cineraria]|uniref:protein NETWORKED 4B-like n=1 Tax=Prosopis cineraria TaxID=364024 RepID=UPI00240EE71D|nr:protein NETWORKED 4B-like [Prosopis cineraria]XP_054793928.1 protein NETWORKED 4B-like [Prosopis cineraria]